MSSEQVWSGSHPEHSTSDLVVVWQLFNWTWERKKKTIGAIVIQTVLYYFERKTVNHSMGFIIVTLAIVWLHCSQRFCWKRWYLRNCLPTIIVWVLVFTERLVAVLQFNVQNSASWFHSLDLSCHVQCNHTLPELQIELSLVFPWIQSEHHTIRIVACKDQLSSWTVNGCFFMLH